MNEQTIKLVKNFTKKNFPIKRIRVGNKKWSRVIVIPKGYIRKQDKIYSFNPNGFNHKEIISDITNIISAVFGINKTLVEPIVKNYAKQIRIF